MESKIIEILDLIIRGRYEKNEFNSVAVKFPNRANQDLILNKLDSQTFKKWEDFQLAFQEKMGENYKVKSFTFPGNQFFGLKLYHDKNEVLRQGLYFYVSMISPFFIIYSISRNIKLGYPESSELDQVSIFKEIFDEFIGIEFPYKYWGIQPQFPYYFDENVPHNKLAYFDIFFGGPSLYASPFHGDTIKPINDYGIKLEKLFIKDLSTLVMQINDPLAY